MDEEHQIDPVLLTRVARRFACRPEFLGFWLDLYREVEGLEPSALARELGCGVETLNDLAVCLKPAPEALARASERLSARFGVERKALIRVIVQAEGYARARTAAPQREGTSSHLAIPQTSFAAARDRDEAIVDAPETPDCTGPEQEEADGR